MRDWKSTLVVFVAFAVGLGADCECDPPDTVDEPASNLEVKATFIDVDEAPSDGKQPVVVQFFRGGTFVQLAGNATISCNSVTLTWNGLGYAERVPLVAPGAQYTVAHDRASVQTRMMVVAPARPVITSPTTGATLARSPAVPITYVAGSGVGVRPGAGGPTSGISGASQPDNGSATVDATGVGAGPGTVSITRDLEGTVGGTGFAAASFSYAVSKDTRVTWQ